MKWLKICCAGWVFSLNRFDRCRGWVLAWSIAGLFVLRPATGEAQSLIWMTNSQATAFAQAIAEGKQVLLLAGRDTCAYCQRMKKTICESTDPPIREFLTQGYVFWYCQVDVSREYKPYAEELGNFSLPLVCIIDPANPSECLDRSTGLQSAQIFYQRLLDRTICQSPSLPRLRIERVAGRIRVSWEESSLWKLQSAAPGLAWEDSLHPVAVQDGRCYILLELGTESCFFRLVPAAG